MGKVNDWIVALLYSGDFKTAHKLPILNLSPRNKLRFQILLGWERSIQILKGLQIHNLNPSRIHSEHLTNSLVDNRDFRVVVNWLHELSLLIIKNAYGYDACFG